MKEFLLGSYGQVDGTTSKKDPGEDLTYQEEIPMITEFDSRLQLTIFNVFIYTMERSRISIVDIPNMLCANLTVN